MADNDPPPVNGDDPPDTNQKTLEQRATAAEAALQQAFDLTRDALKAANPTLPDDIFAATDIPTLMHNMRIAHATVEATKPADTNPTTAARTNPTTTINPTIAINPGPATREPTGPPEGTRSIARIRFGLEQLAARNQ